MRRLLAPFGHLSFRGRLTLAIAAAVAVAVALGAVGAYFAARGQLIGQVDASLRAEAVQLSRMPPDRLLYYHGPFGAGNYQVVDANGNSQHPEEMVSLPVTQGTRRVAAGQERPFYSNATVQGIHVRMFTFQVADGLAVQIVGDVTSIDHALARLRWILLLVGVGGIGLAAVLALAVMRTALAPVRRLTRATEYVAETRDLSGRIEVKGHDELARLAGSFNTMLGALEESVRAQRQLVADASHELRTPLTSLRTNIEVLARSGELEPDERERLLDDVVEQLSEMSTLVAELVLLARGEQPEGVRETIQLDTLVAGAVERARRHYASVVFATSLHESTIEGVPSAIERAVGNLLDNAAKWSPPGGTVEVFVHGPEVTVRDHGPGIDPDDLPYVFDRFYRAAAARRLPGSGLGLAIVKQVAETHGGSVVAAAAPGGGAMMRLRLAPASGDGAGPAAGAQPQNLLDRLRS